MKNLYELVINRLLESTNMYKTAKVNINYIYKQCLEHLYTKIDINYLITSLKKNNYDINNIDKNDLEEIYEIISSDISNDIFSNIIKKHKLNNNREIYDDLITDTRFLSDIYSYIYPRIQSIINKTIPNKPIIDFNTFDFIKKKKLIDKILKKIIENNPKKYCLLDLKQNISKIKTDRISPNNFLKDFINQYKNLLADHENEIIRNLVVDTIDNLNKMLNVQLNATIQDDIEQIIKNDINSYLKFICSKVFTDEKEIKRLLSKSIQQLQDIKQRVMKAYDNVVEWLKSDYPDLKLRKLTEDHIYIYPDYEHEAAGFCIPRNPVEIHLSQSTANSNQTRLSEVIYYSASYHKRSS